MENRARKTREKYEKKLQKAINKSGGITLIYERQEISAIQIAQPKGFYAVDEDDLSIIRIDGILQEVATGQIMLFNKEYADYFRFDFAFTGSKEECLNFMLDQQEENKEKVATLHLSFANNLN